MHSSKFGTKDLTFGGIIIVWKCCVIIARNLLKAGVICCGK